MDRVRNIRWSHLGFLSLYGFFGALALGLFGVVMIEVRGPSEEQAGRIVDLIEGDTERCSGAANSLVDRCETYPTFTVIGERADGTRWLVVGQGAFDSVQPREEVLVTTSTITGRVVGLDGEDTWSVRSDALYPFSIAVLVVASGLGLGYEVARRRGRFVDGPFQRSDFVVLLPTVVAGLTVAWFILFWRTFGLDA